MTALSDTTILAKVITCRGLSNAAQRRVRKAFLMHTLPWDGEYNILKADTYSKMREAIRDTSASPDCITLDLKAL